MSSKEKRQRRSPRQAELRARNWISQQERQALQNQPKRSVAPNLGVFTVRRAVLGSTPGGIYERSKVLDLLHDAPGIKVVQKLGASLISPREGRQIVDPWDGKAGSIRNRLEVKALTLPPQLSGYIGRAVIFGATRHKTGPRFIALSLDQQTTETIKQERRELYDSLGMACPDWKFCPHVTLLETRDQLLADNLRDQFNDMEIKGMPVEFGKADVITIRNLR